MTDDAERLALELRAAHPDADPLDVDAETAAAWLREAGADPDDDLLARVIVAWESLL